MNPHRQILFLSQWEIKWLSNGIAALKDNHGQSVLDNREKAELLNEYFGSVLLLIIVLLIKLDNNSDIIIIDNNDNNNDN